MTTIKSIKRQFMSHRKGIIAGSVIAVAMVLFAQFSGKITSTVTQSIIQQQSILDKVITNVAPVDLAFFKLLLTAIIIGGIIGYIIDNIIP